MMWIGLGVIGRHRLGLGYISPVSTLIKWFRTGAHGDRMAIMGFGGGAMIGAPLANSLMTYFRTPDSVACGRPSSPWRRSISVFMMGGAVRLSPAAVGLGPAGWTPKAATTMIAGKQVHLKDAHKTKQFWLDLGGAVPERIGRHRRDRHGFAVLQEFSAAN